MGKRFLKVHIHLVDNFASAYGEAVKTNCTECLKIEVWLKNYSLFDHFIAYNRMSRK